MDSIHTTERYKATIIISSCQGIEYLPKCLACLKKQTYQNYEVIIVDAGSTDSSQEYIRINHPQMKLIECGRIGLGEAINIGIQNSSGDIICFDLNTDEYVFENWLEELINKLKQHDFNIIAGTTRLINGTNLIDEAGVGMNFFGVIKKNGHGLPLDKFKYTDSKTDFVGSPAFHRKLLKKIGRIDEGYYIYAEDLDFCYRAGRLGIETHVAFNARSRHHIMGTTGRDLKKREYLLRRAHIRFMIIHSGVFKMICRLIYAGIGLPLAALLRSAFSGRHAWESRQKFIGRVQAVYWNIRHIRDTLKKKSEYYQSAGRA